MFFSHKNDLIGIFAQHKVAANLLMIMMILAGAWALAKLNTQFFPNFALDVVTVRVAWTGAAAEDVEDTDTNVTRFVILSKEKSWAARGAGDQLMMTTFVFRVHNIPAALYKAMGGFATNGVNMTKLESYQLGGKFFSTQFYADIEGHPDDKNVAQALKELAFFSREVRILGVYPAHAFRESQSDSLD